MRVKRAFFVFGEALNASRPLKVSKSDKTNVKFPILPIASLMF